MRVSENFNQNWHFVKAPDLSAAQGMEWEAVTLPHTWNNVDGQDGGNDYYRGTCLYVKNLKYLLHIRAVTVFFWSLMVRQ